MNKILITGATGLLGTHLSKILAHNYKLYIVSRNKSEHHIANSEFINLDFTEDWSTKDLPKDIDCIIHLSQSAFFKEFPQHAKEVYYVNTLSTLKLLDHAVKNNVKKFIYTSSGGVYGYSDRAFLENQMLKIDGELGFYLSTKLSSEILIENYQAYLDVIILRPFFLYGPGQRETMLIPRLAQSIQEGKAINLQGFDGIKINPTYVEDAALAVSKAVELKGSYKINIAGPNVLTLRQMAEIIGAKIGKKPVFSVNSAARPKNIIGDTGAMEKYLVMPTTLFEDGIEKFLDSQNK